MKISIDTVQDSKEDIRKAIRLLQAFVEHEQAARDIFSSPSPSIDAPGAQAQSPVSAFGSLFSDDASVQKAEDVVQKEDTPKIELY